MNVEEKGLRLSLMNRCFCSSSPMKDTTEHCATAQFCLIFLCSIEKGQELHHIQYWKPLIRHDWTCPDVTNQSTHILYCHLLVALMHAYFSPPQQLQVGLRPTTALSRVKEWIFWNSTELCFTLAHSRHQLCDMCNCFKTLGLCAQYPKLHTIAEGFSTAEAVNCQR